MADGADDKLVSWKQIADFLKVDTRTAQRWELELRLPVHRPADSKGYSVFAYRAELASWLRSRAGQKPGDNEGAADKGNGGHIADLLSAPAGKPAYTGFARIGSVQIEPAHGGVASTPRQVEVMGGSVEEAPAGTDAEWAGARYRSGSAGRDLSKRGAFLPGVALGVALALTSIWLWRRTVLWLSRPQITAVSLISADRDQEIIIEGSRFGYYYTPQNGLDTAYLAIGDDTGHWSAGRTVPQNADDVTLKIRTWADTQIVIEGFAGAYGEKGYTLKSGDKLRVRVWNPGTGAGPAEYFITVGPARTPSANK
jgi:hypothetical protein